jgi:hypothetical protein
MKRDMELVRLVLLDAEGEELVDLSSYTEDQIGYHRWLVLGAGLADGSETTGAGETHRSALLIGLTWQGHDFLDNARNDLIWKRTLQAVAERGGSVSFAIFQSLLIATAKSVVGL